MMKLHCRGSNRRVWAGLDNGSRLVDVVQGNGGYLAISSQAMTDILIRDVPDDVIAMIDANARRVGLSRSEYLRRALASERGSGDVTVGDLSQFARTFHNLGDPVIMGQAWE
jgi:hypothetical protein